MGKSLPLLFDSNSSETGHFPVDGESPSPLKSPSFSPSNRECKLLFSLFFTGKRNRDGDNGERDSVKLHISLVSPPKSKCKEIIPHFPHRLLSRIRLIPPVMGFRPQHIGSSTLSETRLNASSPTSIAKSPRQKQNNYEILCRGRSCPTPRNLDSRFNLYEQGNAQILLV